VNDASAIHRRRPEYVAEGHTRDGYRAVVVRFDPETHAKIRAMAIKAGVSFAEQVRTLLQWGMDADDS